MSKLKQAAQAMSNALAKISCCKTHRSDVVAPQKIEAGHLAAVAVTTLPAVQLAAAKEQVAQATVSAAEIAALPEVPKVTEAKVAPVVRHVPKRRAASNTADFAPKNSTIAREAWAQDAQAAQLRLDAILAAKAERKAAAQTPAKKVSAAPAPVPAFVEFKPAAKHAYRSVGGPAANLPAIAVKRDPGVGSQVAFSNDLIAERSQAVRAGKFKKVVKPTIAPKPANLHADMKKALLEKFSRAQEAAGLNTIEEDSDFN